MAKRVVLAAVLACAASCGLRLRPAICPDGLPVQILQDPACRPDGVCGYSCLPKRWDGAGFTTGGYGAEEAPFAADEGIGYTLSKSERARAVTRATLLTRSLVRSERASCPPL